MRLSRDPSGRIQPVRILFAEYLERFVNLHAFRGEVHSIQETNGERAGPDNQPAVNHDEEDHAKKVSRELSGALVPTAAPDQIVSASHELWKYASFSTAKVHTLHSGEERYLQATFLARCSAVSVASWRPPSRPRGSTPPFAPGVSVSGFSISVFIPERPWIPPDHDYMKKRASETDLECRGVSIVSDKMSARRGASQSGQ